MKPRTFNFGYLVLLVGLVVLPLLELATGTWGSPFWIVAGILIGGIGILVLWVLPFVWTTSRRGEVDRLRKQFPQALVIWAMARSGEDTEFEPSVLIVDSGGISRVGDAGPAQPCRWTDDSAASIERDYFGAIEATLHIRISREVDLAAIPLKRYGTAPASVGNIESIACRINAYIADRPNSDGSDRPHE